MATNLCNYNLLLIISMLIAQCWTIYLPENTKAEAEQHTIINQLNGIEQLQQQQINHKLYRQFKENTNNTTASAQDTTTGLRKQQQQQERRHQIKSYDKNDDVAVGLIERLPTHTTTDDDDDDVTTNISADVLLTQRHRTKRALVDDSWLIAPDTRWCGSGNIANGTYNHLGGASSADKCCRKHDHCKLYIPAMSSRYELFNYRPYTLSHCSCDRRFRTCLKMANDEAAFTIGKLFFNVVQTHCFIIKHDKSCQKRSINGSCPRASLRKNRSF